MFRVTTLDLENVPRNEDGTVDYTQDFFGKSANLTVSGQLQAENFAMAFGDVYTLSLIHISKRPATICRTWTTSSIS